MCLILFAHRVHPDFRLALAANRDEFFRRPTEPFSRWSDRPVIHAGRDSLAGGTWLGVTPAGRWAAVTNFHDGTAPDANAPSRGALVADFLDGNVAPTDYVANIATVAPRYNGFNLLVGNATEVVWLSNRGPASGDEPVGSAAPNTGSGEAEPGGSPTQAFPDAPSAVERVVSRVLEPGVYGVSNNLLDVPWPKVVRGKTRLREVLAAEETPTPDALLEILFDTSPATEYELPRTGATSDVERAMSAAFIILPDYGTRSSTALLIPDRGEIEVVERRFSPGGSIEGETRATV